MARRRRKGIESIFFLITENLLKKRQGLRKVVNFKSLERSNRLKMHIMATLIGLHKRVRIVLRLI